MGIFFLWIPIFDFAIPNLTIILYTRYEIWNLFFWCKITFLITPLGKLMSQQSFIWIILNMPMGHKLRRSCSGVGEILRTGNTLINFWLCSVNFILKVKFGMIKITFLTGGLVFLNNYLKKKPSLWRLRSLTTMVP